MNFQLLRESDPTTLKDITEREAFDLVCRMRWTDGKPICPRCQTGEPYELTSRQKWSCREPKCRMHFSPTSGTAFGYHKLGYRKLVLALHALLTVTSKRGIRRVCRVRGLEYKTLWVLDRKIKAEMAGTTFTGYYQRRRHAPREQ